MEKKNQVLMTVLGVFALVIVTVGVSYAFFTYTRTSVDTPTITTGSLDFGFTEEGSQNVTLENALPIDNDVAAAVTATTENVAVYDFNVSYHTSGDVVTTYDVSIVKQEGATLDNKFVKVALFENSTNLGTKTLDQALAAPLVDDKVIANNDNNAYSLKMWIDGDLAGFDASDNGTGTLTPGENDNYTAEDKQTATAAWSGKTLSVKVKVDATGTAQ